MTALDGICREDIEALVLMLLAVLVLLTWPLTASLTMPVERMVERNILSFFGTCGLIVYWGWRRRTVYDRKWCE